MVIVHLKLAQRLQGSIVLVELKQQQLVQLGPIAQGVLPYSHVQLAHTVVLVRLLQPCARLVATVLQVLQVKHSVLQVLHVLLGCLFSRCVT